MSFLFFLHLVSILICWEVVCYFLPPLPPFGSVRCHSLIKAVMGAQNPPLFSSPSHVCKRLVQTFVVLSFFYYVFFLLPASISTLIVFLSCLIYFSFSLCSLAASLSAYSSSLHVHMKTCFLVADTPCWSSWEMFSSPDIRADITPQRII
jgi:hypothetical protein